MTTQTQTTTPRRRPSRGLAPAALALAGALHLLCLGAATPAAAGERTGEQIYRADCQRCHGARGEGSAEFKRSLAGDKSVDQLAKLVEKTMPEDDPGTCTGDDARKVSEYLYDAFYSRTARERNKPPRIELSRLTVRQYLNAVADLVGSFRSPAGWDDRRGLRGEYYDGRDFRDRARVIDRRDPVVRFDFGEGAPDPAKFKTPDFTIRWEGSVLAPDTGDYEFVVRTEHATRLYVNDPRRPLIDAWVKSGHDTEYRATIRLLGGRAYPLTLEFVKGKQGVDDSKKDKGKKKPGVKATVALLWKPPHRVDEVIPERNLSPAGSPVTFVLSAPFPPDDRSAGYERGASVSKAWDQAATDAAIETAGYVVAHLGDLSGVSDTASDRPAKLRTFARSFAERAFRRPLAAEQEGLYVDRQFKGAKTPDEAVKRVVLGVLKSPRFLYREVTTGRPDPYDVAARLSFGMWDSLPDQALLSAASSGKLGTPAEVAAQADRMAGDLRARAKVRAFLLQWLRVDLFPDVAKDPKLFPGFDPAVVSDLRTSLELMLDDVVWGEPSDFRRFFGGDAYFLNGRLAAFYGVKLPADAPFRKVAMETQRAGLLTHPYLLSTFAYTGSTSPIHRGVFIARGVLGRALRTPPIAVAPLAPDLHAGLTTRERVALQTSPAACQSCHSMINPLGFPLEEFDAVGRFRTIENAKPVDATGSYQTVDGTSVTFRDARDFAAYLAGSAETHRAFVEQLFHYLVKQPVRAYGPDQPEGLRKAFAAGGFNVRKLLVEIMTASALAPRDARPEVALAH